jgi:hypothetical protein
MNIPPPPPPNGGSSLRHGAAGAWFQAGSNAKAIASSASYTGRQISLKEGFTVNFKNRSILIDDLEFRANTGGFDLRDEDIYGVIFNAAGNYEGVVSTPKLDQFLAHDNKFMILLSYNPAITTLAGLETGPEGGLYLFLGYPGQQASVQQIWWDVSLTAEDIGALLDTGLPSLGRR